MSPPTQSDIWNYFEPNIEDHDKADCKICNKSYSRKGRTTSSLKNHLKSMHPEEFSILESISKEKQLLQKIKSETTTDCFEVQLSMDLTPESESQENNIKTEHQSPLSTPVPTSNTNSPVPNEISDTTEEPFFITPGQSASLYKTSTDPLLNKRRTKRKTTLEKLREARLESCLLQNELLRQEIEYKKMIWEEERKNAHLRNKLLQIELLRKDMNNSTYVRSVMDKW